MNNYIKKIYLIAFDENADGWQEESYRKEITAEDLTIEDTCEFLRVLPEPDNKYRAGARLIRQYFLNEEDLEDEDPFYESELNSYSNNLATKNEIKKAVKKLKTESEIYPEFFYTQNLDINDFTTLSNNCTVYTWAQDIKNYVRDINNFLKKCKDFYICLGVNFFIDGQKVETLTSQKLTENVTVDNITDFIKQYGGKIREY